EPLNKFEAAHCSLLVVIDDAKTFLNRGLCHELAQAGRKQLRPENSTESASKLTDGKRQISNPHPVCFFLLNWIVKLYVVYTSRQFATTEQFSRFRSEADIDRAAPASRRVTTLFINGGVQPSS